MTKGMSLQIWHTVGVFEREIAGYIELAKRFNKIFIISYGDSIEKQFQNKLPENIEILYKSGKFRNLFYQFLIPFRFRNQLRQCDFLKTNQIYGSLPAILARIFFRRPKLIVRSGYIASLNAFLYKKSFLNRLLTNALEYLAYRLCNKAFITTKENRDFLVKKYPFLGKKISILNNGIDIDIFKPIETEKIYDIGYVGRLNKDKNLLNLLKAAKRLNLKICFVGRGEEKDNLEKFAQTNNISLKIIDCVENYKLPPFYNQCRIFVFPSLHEGNPKALLEAMACELPVIGCNVVGVKNIIKNGINGLLINPDADSLKKAIIRMSKEDAGLKSRITSNAGKFIKKNYNFHTIIGKETNFYEKSN